MISHAAQYAVRALADLARENDGSFTPARTIADRLAISNTFLSKILGRLVESGILVSLRGPTGGLRLQRPADEITVRDVVSAIDGEGLFTDCVLGLPGCGEAKPCPLHASWAETRSRIERSLASQTIADLARGVEAGTHRVAP